MFLLIVPAILTTDATFAQELRSFSKAPYAHRITLYDHDGEAIDPADEAATPYSPMMTCGKCHAVATIDDGWHFNAGHVDVAAGRPGEPWIFSDPDSGTQLPISARGWSGTFTPDELGLNDWAFVQRFGRHMPGGGVGDPSRSEINSSAESIRWDISGTVQIDCMVCHSADGRHDPAEAARQIEKENYKWIPTVALGLAVVRGQASKVPDDFDPYAPPNPDFPEQALPKLIYDRARFDGDDRVFFNVTRRPASDRCFACHSTRQVGPQSPSRWETQEDVHLTAGMTCTDCHRNDIGHMITRGYAGEADLRNEPAAAIYSCRGCHLGSGVGEAAGRALGGGYGAPHPLHKGMPTVHFEKLTCTACHSGPWPDKVTKRVQTSMAHALGLASKERQELDQPAIHEPIFAADQDGLIAPHRMLWPSYWARRNGETIVPIPPADVARVMATNRIGGEGEEEAGRSLTDEQIASFILSIQDNLAGEGDVVYVRNGRVHQRTSDGSVEASDYLATGAYRWPLAHAVRPAAQSLGVRGCTDCHANDAPFYYGRIAGDDENAGATPAAFMYELQGADFALLKTWATLFRFRPALKWGGLVCSVLLAGVLLLFALNRLNRFLRRID